MHSIIIQEISYSIFFFMFLRNCCKRFNLGLWKLANELVKWVCYNLLPFLLLKKLHHKAKIAATVAQKVF